MVGITSACELCELLPSNSQDLTGYPPDLTDCDIDHNLEYLNKDPPFAPHRVNLFSYKHL